MSPTISFRALDLTDPTLNGWHEKLRSRTPHFDHEVNGPKTWTGLYKGDHLLAAVGFSFMPANTVVVECAVCEPSKDGLYARNALCLSLKKFWAGKRIIFFTEISNKKMLRFLTQAIKAVPVAAMMEVYGG